MSIDRDRNARTLMPAKKIIAAALSVAVSFLIGVSSPASLLIADSDDPNIAVISPRNVSYTTEQAFIGSLVRTASHDARLDFPNTVSVFVPKDGISVNMVIKGGDWVEKGDPIATFSVVSNELEIDEATLALELAVSVHNRDIANLEDALNNALAAERDALEAYDAAQAGATPLPAPLRPYELSVAAAYENLEFAKYSGERNLGFMRARLAELIERDADFTIYAPISGFVFDIVYFTEGRSVPRNQFVCRVSDPSVFQLIIKDSGLSQLRFGAAVDIETTRRDDPVFPGHVIGNSMLLGKHDIENTAIVAFDDPQAILELSGGSATRLASIRYRVAVTQSDIKNVLLAPRRAINNEASYRYVNILEDGLSKKRYVLVGLSNVEYVQILDGIKAGDELILK